jgi:hypothetical protein
MGVVLQGTENQEVTIESERVAQKGEHRQGGTSGRHDEISTEAAAKSNLRKAGSVKRRVKREHTERGAQREHRMTRTERERKEHS